MIALLAALLAGAAPAPFACPKGSEHRGAAPPEAYEEWCEAKDPAGGPPRREGPSRTYYDDASPWIETTWRAGLRHGPFVEWHRNGAKAREGAFTEGRRSGRWTTWSDSGRVEEEGDWKDGVPHGRFGSFWPAGRPRTEGRYCGGAQCGTWRTWDETGRELGTVDYGEQTLAP